MLVKTGLGKLFYVVRRKLFPLEIRATEKKKTLIKMKKYDINVYCENCEEKSYDAAMKAKRTRKVCLQLLFSNNRLVKLM